MIERQWRTIGDNMRANMAHARHLPDTYWWYALRDGVSKSWVIPVERGANKSSWELFTGRALRTQKEPLGLRRDDGALPAAVDEANRTADHACAIMHAAHEHGAFFIAEAPPGRGLSSRFPLPGREDHTPLFDHPAFLQLRDDCNANIVYFDQCMTREDPAASPEKKTALLASPGALVAVRSHFGPLVCNHSAPHPAMTGVDADGMLRSTAWEAYSSHMNYLLARCLHESDRDGGPASARAPPVVSSMSLHRAGDDPMHDWGLMYTSPNVVWDDTALNDVPFDAINACAPLRAHQDFVANSLYSAGVDGQHLTKPRAADPDNPTRSQAMAGGEWQEWCEAIDGELTNLQRHGVYEEVLEDTLPTWSAARGYASEVVNIITILKKKYLDGVFDKFKARFVYDGRMQKRLNSTAENPLDTFAPTARHSTQKLLCAVACKRGANRTTLHSRAYIERVAKKYLTKPIESYPKYDTPCSKDIIKDYEEALLTRTETTITPEMQALKASYPRKVGAIVYCMPASRCDAAYGIGMLTRCLTFPTPAMDRHADRCLVYLAQNSEYGITYDGNATETQLHGFSDSDWCVGHSTTGFAVCFAGAAIGYGSRRQHSVAMSSTEAEIMAASHTALEILYFRGLLREMGEDMTEPTVLYVDNMGAVALSKDLKSCQRSRHIERRYLKVRECVAQGEIVVKYRETTENPADMLTKPLDGATFRKHADTLMANNNTAGIKRSSSTIRQQTYDVEAAYLKGEFEGEVLHARPPPTGPPPGRRPYIRGVPVVWRLKAPLYGEADAGRIWNRTMVKHMTAVQKYTQSKYDPCYFFKILSDGTRQDVVMYVDDGYCVDSGTAAADAELRALHDKFTIDIKPATFFLGNNITVSGA